MRNGKQQFQGKVISAAIDVADFIILKTKQVTRRLQQLH